ncbi:MAG: PASTA domain-containing protein [Candidatus Delongbacteria bacterium]|jgi:beta-lactam-binding protein with PASTA domain|nr:PASTA domain-containing protein [Candidatus Delongbacteria bacterium]
MKFIWKILKFVTHNTKAISIFIMTILVVGFISIFIFDNVIMPSYTSLGNEYPVPDVTERYLDEAKRILEMDGFILSDEVTEKIDYKVLPGIIVEHYPKPGSICKKGRKIYVTISKGGLPAIVPNLIGLSPQDAKYNILDSKLYLDSILYEFSVDFPEGVVIGQSLVVNDSVVMGDSLFIVVSLGKHPTEFVIPSVKGKNIEEAAEIINKSGFMIGEVVYYKDEDLLPGTVIDQKPPKDEIVYQGTEIRLLVSTLVDPPEKIEFDEETVDAEDEE